MTQTTPTSKKLSENQMEVLVLLSKGFEQREIARLLGITLNAAKCRAREVYRKLGAHNAAEAVSEGYQLGLLKVIE